jgi:hypothetical protein
MGELRRHRRISRRMEGRVRAWLLQSRAASPRPVRGVVSGSRWSEKAPILGTLVHLPTTGRVVSNRLLQLPLGPKPELVVQSGRSMVLLPKLVGGFSMARARSSSSLLNSMMLATVSRSVNDRASIRYLSALVRSPTTVEF